MLFVECSSTSRGQEFESTFSTAVCKIQLCAKYSSRMCYIESTLIIPSVPKEKNCFSQWRQKVCCTAAFWLCICPLEVSYVLNWHLETIYAHITLQLHDIHMTTHMTFTWPLTWDPYTGCKFSIFFLYILALMTGFLLRSTVGILAGCWDGTLAGFVLLSTTGVTVFVLVRCCWGIDGLGGVEMGWGVEVGIGCWGVPTCLGWGCTGTVCRLDKGGTTCWGW